VVVFACFVTLLLRGKKSDVDQLQGTVKLLHCMVSISIDSLI
jgi:hypothetical protein